MRDFFLQLGCCSDEGFFFSVGLLLWWRIFFPIGILFWWGILFSSWIIALMRDFLLVGLLLCWDNVSKLGLVLFYGVNSFIVSISIVFLFENVGRRVYLSTYFCCKFSIRQLVDVYIYIWMFTIIWIISIVRCVNSSLSLSNDLIRFFHIHQNRISPAPSMENIHFPM